jgi:hypothetical protein
MLTPRGLTLAEAAEYIGRSRTWLDPARLEELRREGFPQLDPLTGRIDRHALDAWLDRRADIDPRLGHTAEPESTAQLWVEAANGPR